MKCICLNFLPYIIPLLFSVIYYAAEADETVHYSPEDVISRINETYSKVYSAQGRISRTIEIDENQPYRLLGSFTVEKPVNVLIKFAGDFLQYIGFDGKEFRIYFPVENRGVYKKTSVMTFLDRFMSGTELFFGNYTSLLQNGFSITVHDTLNGKIILKATPEKQIHFNYILVGVDPQTWTIQVVEYFNTKNILVSQTKFLEYNTIGDTLIFPRKIIISTIVNNKVRIETTSLTSFKLNIFFEDKAFSIPSNENTKWISHNSNK